jgi:hypothetical protein
MSTNNNTGTSALALSPSNHRGLQLNSLDDMLGFAQIVIRSGLAPRSFDTPEKVIMALVTGAELGISNMQSLQGLSVVQGKIGIGGDLALALCQASAAFEDLKEDWKGKPYDDNYSVTITVKRKGRSETSSSFSVGDAKLAGLWGKRNRDGSPTPWVSYPQRMLRYRALGFVLRDAFPDVLKGIKTTEELKDYPEEANEGFEHAKPVEGARVMDVPVNGNVAHREEPSKENGNGKLETMEGTVENAYHKDQKGRRYYFLTLHDNNVVYTTDDDAGEKLLTYERHRVKLQVEAVPNNPGKYALKRVVRAEEVEKGVDEPNLEKAKEAVRETPSAQSALKNNADEKRALLEQINAKMRDAHPRLSHAQVLEAAKTCSCADDAQESIHTLSVDNLKTILCNWDPIHAEAQSIKPEAVA